FELCLLMNQPGGSGYVIYANVVACCFVWLDLERPKYHNLTGQSSKNIT
ncbi:27969_t:CDS:1, partial [Dentiscutata erythropus]